MFVQQVRQFIRVVCVFAIVLTTATPARAYLHSCEYSFVDTTPRNPRLANRLTVERVAWSEAEIEGPIDDRSGGTMKFHEQPLSSDPRIALREMIDGLSANSARWFSLKDYKQGGPFDAGRFTLAIPIQKGYTVELVYVGEFAHGFRHFRLDRVLISKAFSDPDTISSSPLTAEGRLNPTMNWELKNYPELAGYNYRVGIAPTIPLDALAKFDPVAEKLGFVDKDDMEKLTKINGYMNLAMRIRTSWLIEYAKTYVLLKGPFKRMAAFILTPTIFFLGWVLLPDGTIRKVKDYFSDPDPLVMEKSLTELSATQGLPEEIKKQVLELRKEVLSTVDPNGVQSRDLIRQHKPNTDSTSKFVLSEEKSVWVQRVVDEDTGREIPILFISRFNGQDKMEFSGVKLDATKHRQLIGYIEGQGQFLPFGKSALKQGTKP